MLRDEVANILGQAIFLGDLEAALDVIDDDEITHVWRQFLMRIFPAALVFHKVFRLSILPIS